LEDELTKSKIEIDKYKYEMGRYEENMKRALMRGVCALNLEAMSIFNDENCNNNNNNNNARKTYNSHNIANNENGNSRVNIETYYSNEDINKLDTNNNELNEQLFKSSMNSFGRKIYENENGLKNLIFNYEKQHQSSTINNINSSSTTTSTKIPTIIVENNKTNNIDHNDNIKTKLNNQIVSFLFFIKKTKSLIIYFRKIIQNRISKQKLTLIRTQPHTVLLLLKNIQK
jgi:hypothetical protein